MNRTLLEPSAEGTRLALQHENQLRRILKAVVTVPHLREDAFWDSVAAIGQSYHTYRTGHSFIGWAGAIARNVGISLQRRHGYKAIPLSQCATELLAVEAEEIDHDAELLERRREAVMQCLETLPPRHRKIIMLRYFKERGYVALAGWFRKKPAALRQIVSRCHRRLYACVRQRVPED